MGKSGERHRRNLPGKCPKCGARGAYLARREIGGADVRCPQCEHLYNNPVMPWPFSVPGKAAPLPVSTPETPETPETLSVATHHE
jgi:hypothetical protein